MLVIQHISKACRDGSGIHSTETSVGILITALCTILHYHPYISSCKPGLLKHLLQLCINYDTSMRDVVGYVGTRPEGCKLEKLSASIWLNVLYQASIWLDHDINYSSMLCIRHQCGCVSCINMAQCCASTAQCCVQASIWLNAVQTSIIYGPMMCIRYHNVDQTEA